MEKEIKEIDNLIEEKVDNELCFDIETNQNNFRILEAKKELDPNDLNSFQCNTYIKEFCDKIEIIKKHEDRKTRRKIRLRKIKNFLKRNSILLLKKKK